MLPQPQFETSQKHQFHHGPSASYCGDKPWAAYDRTSGNATKETRAPDGGVVRFVCYACGTTVMPAEQLAQTNIVCAGNHALIAISFQQMEVGSAILALVA